jgi:hypothetical protein
MKTLPARLTVSFHHLVPSLLLLAFGAVPTLPVVGADLPAPVVVERGPHHRVWERTTTEVLPDGTSMERKSGYTELATGLHYQNERGEWLDSKEEIEIVQGAAVARQGQHQAIFAANLNRETDTPVAGPVMRIWKASNSFCAA